MMYSGAEKRIHRRNVHLFRLCLPVRPDPSEFATFSLLNPDPVKEGDTVTMKCETDGNPQPEFDFSKDVKAPTPHTHTPPLLAVNNEITLGTISHESLSVVSGKRRQRSGRTPDAEIRQALRCWCVQVHGHRFRQPGC